MVSQEPLTMLRIGSKTGLTPLDLSVNPDRLRKGLTGFTMIELMVAVVILTVGLVIILQALSSGMFVLNSTQRKYLATRIAAERLENLEEEEKRLEGLDPYTINELVTYQDKKFNVKIVINPHVIDIQKFPQLFLPDKEPEDSTQIEDRLQKVDVHVGWQERSVPQELILTTYFDKRRTE
jgi:prepilin-type N-terminal cleavage/methylation domain-containing protein